MKLENLNMDSKALKYYNPERLHNALFLMEQFRIMSMNIQYTPDTQKQARLLSDHFRRMAVSIILKEFDPAFTCQQLLTKEYMESMFKSEEIDTI